MLFCTSQFVAFFAVVLIAYWLLPWTRARVWLLLVASIYFYAHWNRWLALIIVASTTADFLLALGIDRAASLRVRRVLLSINVIGNLSLLCYFKYVNFFLDSLRVALDRVGANASLPLLQVILPVGISFYTFEAINYVVDVYRGKVRAERNWANFVLFVLFFPHLVAGPIVRAKDFLPQIHRRKRWSWIRAELGLRFLVLGVFKKLLIADRLALLADPVFAEPSLYSTGAIWLAVVAYALQIYCDFSGYTDMAIGCAHLLGYHLAQNFAVPYLAANISEFWRRWHISLSNWLRDYLFIPLGGSRGDEWRTARNLLLTMTLGGLWHGASWTFVVWGVLHGVFLVAHRRIRRVGESWPAFGTLMRSMPGKVLAWMVTMMCVLVGWVFFRAATFADAGIVLQRMWTFVEGNSLPLAHVRWFWLSVVLVVLAHLVWRLRLWPVLRQRIPSPALGAAYCAGLTFAVLLAPPAGKAFIYFQF